MRIGELIKTSAEEGKEKHVPTIELVDCSDCGEKVIRLTVGKETPHPNEMEHHIKWIMLYGVKAGLAVHIATFDLGPTFGMPSVDAHANLEGFRGIVAVEYCNVHGLCESSLTL